MVTELRKSVRDRVLETIYQIESGVPTEKAFEMLYGRSERRLRTQVEKVVKWEGTLADYNTKLQELCSKLGLTVDLGEITDSLMSSGALRVKGNRLTLDTAKASTALERFVDDKKDDVQPAPKPMKPVQSPLTQPGEEDDLPLPDDDDGEDDLPGPMGPGPEKPPAPLGLPKPPPVDEQPARKEPPLEPPPEFPDEEEEDFSDDIETAVKLYFV
jgi:hypothetical protein